MMNLLDLTILANCCFSSKRVVIAAGDRLSTTHHSHSDHSSRCSSRKGRS